VADDVLDLDTKIFGLEAKVGNPPGSQWFENCGTVWDGLEMLGGMVRDLTKEVEKDKRASETSVSALEMRFQEISRNLKNGLETDMMTGFKEVEASMQILADAVKMLSQEQEKLTAALLGLHQGGKMSGGANHPQVGQLLARVKLLEARLPALPGGRLGDESFRSRVDVLAFAEEHVPSNCFYLFHDVVTLMVALTTSHVERKDVLEEWYRSTKVGVNEASARHMASFRLILPTVFGRMKEGSAVSAKHHLPAVRSFKDWNTFDGVSGVKSFISSGMEDLRYQFCQDIERALDSSEHTKARLLAVEMLEASQTFVMEMSSWVDAFYQELVATSEATEEEAWEVIGACLKKMFEVICVPRAQAANATMDTDPRSQCTTYLWALIQSHRIMKEFSDARFRNNGAIAPVIVLHIFKTRVTRTAMTANIKRLEGRISSLEKGGKDKK